MDLDSTRQRPLQGKQIGINAHLLSGEASYRRAGIHQYIAQVLRHLPASQGANYTIFTRHAPAFMQRPDFQVARSGWPTERRLARILWEQTAWPLLAKRLNLDLLHSMAFVTPLLTAVPAIVTVYDLSFLHFPERFPTLQRLYLTSQTRRSCRRARRIIAISESGRRDVARFFGVPLEKIDIVFPGVDPAYRPLPPDQVAAFKERQSLPQRFVLHVGTLQPRKNIPVLIEAFARLADPQLQLVLVGGKGWLFDEIFQRVEALNLQNRIRFTGYVPDGDLPLWYNAATLLALPSVYEGFGMPAVEAMACGTAVVVSNQSSLPEAVGEAGLLFDPQNAAELTERMATVLHNRAVADTMREQGVRQASQFSWKRAGQETAVAYQRALITV